MKRLAAFLAVTLFVCAHAHAAIPQSERDALVAIYNGNNGPNWVYKDHWNDAAGTECQWYAVICDDAQTTVKQLNLGSNNLTGAIPAAPIAALPNLERLDFSFDPMTGHIPDQLSTLTRLKVIDFGYMALDGTIPPFIGNLTNLTNISLHGNKFTGPIPPELGNLVQLQELDLGWNQLSAPIPTALGRLTSLQILDLDLNHLTGPIPTEIGQLRNLQTLSLSINQLQGPIPHEIGNLSQLAQLLLAYDGLSGTIPDELYSLRQLTTLSLAGNQQLSGPISPRIGNLTALTQLDLNTNKLSGPIPVEINSLTALTELDLQENALSGAIPRLDGLQSLVTLDLGANQLTGPIPQSIGTLSKLENLAIYQNNIGGTIPESLKNLSKLANINLSAANLTGPLPDWMFQFANLQTLYVGYNQLSGPLSPALTGAVKLQQLDLSQNQLTGQIPSAIGNLQQLDYLSFNGNDLGGPIPDSLWTLKSLTFLDLSSNQLTGTLSPQISNLKKVRSLFLQDNRLSGVLPREIGSLPVLDLLDLGSNEFTGTLPRELGQLKTVEAADFSANNFRSPVPPEIAGMTGLLPLSTDFAYNAFSETDPTLVAFMNRVQFDNDFARSQTVVPTGVKVGPVTDRSAVVTWTPIRYTWDEGGYRVFASLTPGGTPVSVATTASKEIESITVRGLQPSTTYYFTVATVSHPHDFQHNLIVSDSSAPVSATTAARQPAPADIVVTSTPVGLVELDGVPQNDDSFTLTNFGDAASAISLNLYDNDFFDVQPKQFTLAGGASQVVKITAVANRPVGFYYGGVQPTGDGTSDDDIVTTTMLSAKRTGGVAIAQPATNRIEISAAAGIDPVGQVTFKNTGTANLVGVLVSDQPWLVPNNAPITIEPGTSITVGFKIDHKRRPTSAGTGTLTGTLSLIYVGELPQTATADVHAADTTPTSISISKVTVVDVTKPDVSTASAPALSSGEVAYFAAGLLNRGDLNSTLASGLTIVNANGAKAVNDIRLYYSSASEKALAALSSLDSTQGVSIANVVGNVYSPSDQIGSIQVRSVDWQNLLVNANFLRSTGSGTLLGDMPVFRSDRALVNATDKLYLTGIAQSPTVHAALVAEEIGGTNATVSIDFLDNSGALALHRDLQLQALATSEVTDIPANASTIVIANATKTTPTAVLAYVRMSDDSSGDTWSVVDWSRSMKYLRTEAVRLPLVFGGAPAGGGKRRIAHSDAVRTATNASIFNSGTTEARARISSGSASKDVTIPVRQTLTINDVASFLGTTTTGSVVIEPTHGEFVVTSRLASGSTGAALPVVPSQNGLRVGQSQVFSGLEDSAAYRTDYGFVETGGASTTIRATILLSDSHSLFTTVISRDFSLGANAFLYVNELVKSILGDTRGKYGDLHNLQLQLEVVDGSGSILPFVTMTDTATGDTILRIQ